MTYIELARFQRGKRMTCEIAVANRLGIALAADSAVTFTKAGTRGTTATYSSGVNKILQPLRDQPVALMVHDNAALGEMPWELIIKQFRAWNDLASEPLLASYMGRLVAFVEEAHDLFPLDWREMQTQSLYGLGLIRLVATLKGRYPVVEDPQAALPTKAAAAAQFATDIEAELDAAPVPACLNALELTEALAGLANLVTEAAAALESGAPDVAGFLDPATYLRLAVKVTFKWPWEVAGRASGVVIAGYGTSEVLPSFVQRQFRGFVGTRLYWVDGQSRTVPRDGVGALIEAFARKGMVETFTQGISPEAWAQAEEEFRLRAGQLVTDTVAAAGPQAVAPAPNVHADLVIDATREFMSHWASASLKAHWQPLLEVVAGLPMDQLGELAENLVMLESLKERVTHRTQSVGGPIDVAIITKGEGLVWIKRKHYFPPELNRRYFERMVNGG